MSFRDLTSLGFTCVEAFGAQVLKVCSLFLSRLAGGKATSFKFWLRFRVFRFFELE